MATPIQLSSGTWRIQVCKTVNGMKVKRSFTVSPNEFPGDPKTASKKAKAKVELLAREWILSKEEERKDRITVEDAIDRFVDNRDNSLSGSTHKDYKNMKKYFTKILNVELEDVTTDMLQSIINEMAVMTNRYGKRLNTRTIQNRMNFLKGAFNYCELNKRFNLKYPAPDDEKELNPPEVSEFKRILDAVKTDEEMLIVLLAAFYTLRRGEIGGLRGQDILWDMHSIRISHSRVQNYKKEWILRPPKTKKSIRTIEVAPDLMQLIPHVGPNEFIVSKNPNEITKMFERIRKIACVHCRFHDLRKFAASTRSDVMPKKYVEADGGWKAGSSKVLETIYDKPFKEERKRYAKAYNEKIMSEFGEKILGNN